MRARKLTTKYRSIFIRTAVSLGLLEPSRANEAARLLERAPDEEDTGDLLVEAGVLSERDARAVKQAQAGTTAGALDLLNSKFAQAGLAIKGATTAAEEVVRLTRGGKAQT